MHVNVPLYDFSFFGVGLNQGPWIGDIWQPFYVGGILDGVEQVLPQVPVVAQWHIIGSWPVFGISFLDETGGYPPMIIHEFEDIRTD